VQEKNFPLYKLDELITVYDIFGRTKKLPLEKGVGGIFSINVSTLQKGID